MTTPAPFLPCHRSQARSLAAATLLWTLADPGQAQVSATAVVRDHLTINRGSKIFSTPHFSMAYDKARACVVLHDPDSQSMWEWRGDGWRKRAESTASMNLTFSETEGRCLAMDDQGTWAFDGQSWALLGPTPLAALGIRQGFVHDSYRRRTVLFGGWGTTTWEFDGSTWKSIPTTIQPPAGDARAMVFDSVRNRTVLLASGTWEWDGTVWTRRQPRHSPPGRGGYGAVFDTSRGVMVFPTHTDVWEWDGVNWTQTPAPNAPQFSYGQLAYDEARSEVVAVTTGFAEDTSTWTWNGSAWRQHEARVAEVPRCLAIATDPVRQQVLSFGGKVSGHSTWYHSSDTLLWDGSGWSRLTTNTSPPGRSEAALFYDSSRAMITMFGGHQSSGSSGGWVFNDLWAFDGRDWAAIATATTPPARRNTALAFDGRRGSAVLFGGGGPGGRWWPATFLGDTWEWDGADWAKRSPTVGPAARYGHCMTYDAARGRTVLFGGLTSAGSSNETWEWDGIRWRLLQPATQPPGGPGGSIAFDPRHSKVVLRKGGLWTWDGIDWRRITASLGSFAAMSRSMAIDPGTGALLVPIRHGRNNSQPGTQLIGDLVAASSTPAGPGCGRGTATPELRVVPPILGTTFAFELLDAAPASLALLLVSPNRGSLLLSGCTLHLGAALTPVTIRTNQYGVGTLPIAVPQTATLRGLELHSQAAVLDPVAVPGFTLSDARRIILGDGQ